MADFAKINNGSLEFTIKGIKYKFDSVNGKISAAAANASSSTSVDISFKDPGIVGTSTIKAIPGLPGISMSAISDGKGTFKFSSNGGLFSGIVKYDVPTGKIISIGADVSIASSIAGGVSVKMALTPTLQTNGDIIFAGTTTAKVAGFELWARDRTITADDRSFLDLFSFAYDDGKNPLLNTFDRFKSQKGFNNIEGFKQLQELGGIFNILTPAEGDAAIQASINEYLMSAESAIGSSNTFMGFSEYWSGEKKNFLEVAIVTDPAPVGASIEDATSSISANNSTLGSPGDYTFGTLLGNANTSRGLQAIANDLIADSFRPGNFNLTLGLPTDALSRTGGLSLFDSLATDLTGNMFNTGSQDLFNWDPTDPLVLDLNGDGQINNISETLSEYYKGVVGSNDVAGTKPYTNGFTTLKILYTGNGTVGSAGYGDSIFDSKDAAWANLREWVGANHDGKSWIDTKNNGIKEAAETTTELQTSAALGITQMNTAQSGEVRDGNEVLARGIYVKNGVGNEPVAARRHSFRPPRYYRSIDFLNRIKKFRANPLRKGLRRRFTGALAVALLAGCSTPQKMSDAQLEMLGVHLGVNHWEATPQLIERGYICSVTGAKREYFDCAKTTGFFLSCVFRIALTVDEQNKITSIHVPEPACLGVP